MTPNSNISKIINELTSMWLGKYGVIAIFEEHRKSETIIKFLVKNLTKNEKKLPEKYKDITIVRENIDNIIPHEL
jgi:hypothetical protein